MVIDARSVLAHQIQIVNQQYQQLRREAVKFHLNFQLETPKFIIPRKFDSSEVFLLNLGDLNAQTTFIDDVERSLVEQQNIILKDISISRIRSNANNDATNEIFLLNKSEWKISIERPFYPMEVRNGAKLLIKIDSHQLQVISLSRLDMYRDR